MAASSFSHKPYLFNRANLERFSGGCPLADRRGPGGCPFDASYEALQARLFRPLDPRAEAIVPPSTAPSPLSPPLPPAPGPANPALRAHPAAPALFVFDTELIEGRSATTGGAPLAPGRLRFLRECLAELPVAVREGDGARELLAAAAAAGADGLVTSRAVNPRFALIAAQVATTVPLRILEPEPFVDLPWDGPLAPDLRRFSRYWRRAEPRVWGEG